MFQRLGIPELLLILAIFLLLFGSAKLPALGRSIGEAIRNFKKGMKETQDEDKEEKDDKK